MKPDVYRQLQQHLDRMPVPFPATDSGVELRILQRLFTPEEADLALALSAIPEPPRTIRRRAGGDWTLELVVAALESMAERGLVERIGRGGKKRYGKSVLAVGIYERQLTRLTPELQREIEEYFEAGFGKAFHSVRPQQMRTVPVGIDLAPERLVTTYDDIRSFVDSSEGPFAVMDCICRRGRDLTGEPCSQTEVRSTCLTFGPAARGMVDGGAAHYIDRREALDVLTLADREGLVLQPQNTEKPLFVCCCCGCCCGVLRSAKEAPAPAELFAANYFAEVDGEACSGCATCEERCQMDAVSLVDDTATVDLSRCIGCALCVTTCATGAMALLPKPDAKKPARNTPALYMQMYRERFGAYESAKATAKALLRMRV
jgi:Na+-translocating ferredoxin:NAD+ oxidoreductase subunit B